MQTPSVSLKTYLLILFIALLIVLGGCGKKSSTPVKEGTLIRVSYAEKGDGIDQLARYTVNIEVDCDGTVRIYADQFEKWMPETACPEDTYQLEPAVMEELRAKVDEAPYGKLRSDMGNRDQTDGVFKTVTVFMEDGEHTYSGLNPSNRNFLALYDAVYNVTKERAFTYVSSVNEMQQKAKKAVEQAQIHVICNADELLFSEDKIKAVYLIPPEGEEPEGEVPPEDAIPAAKTEWTGKLTDEYYGAMLLTDEGVAAMADYSSGSSEEFPVSLQLYIGTQFLITFKADTTIEKNLIYFEHSTNKEQVKGDVDALKKALR